MKNRHIVLVPGDEFSVILESHLADQMYCPRSNIRLQWNNADSFFTWIKDTGGTGGGNTNFIGGTTGVIINTDGRPGGSNSNLEPQGTSQRFRTIQSVDSRKMPIMSSFNPVFNFDNYDEEHDRFPRFIVPEGMLDTNHVLDYNLIDTETNEVINYKVNLYIRKSHNTLIPIEADSHVKR